MKIIIESTEKLVTLNGVPARIWEGVTESGIQVHAYVTRVAVDERQGEAALAEFARELAECKPPSAAVAAIPSRLVL